MLGDRGLVLWCMVNLLVLLGLFGAFEHNHWFDVILLGDLEYDLWFDAILCLVEHPYCLVMPLCLCPMPYLC